MGLIINPVNEIDLTAPVENIDTEFVFRSVKVNLSGISGVKSIKVANKLNAGKFDFGEYPEQKTTFENGLGDIQLPFPVVNFIIAGEIVPADRHFGSSVEYQCAFKVGGDPREFIIKVKIPSPAGYSPKLSFFQS